MALQIASTVYAPKGFVLFISSNLIPYRKRLETPIMHMVAMERELSEFTIFSRLVLRNLKRMWKKEVTNNYTESMNRPSMDYVLLLLLVVKPLKHLARNEFLYLICLCGVIRLQS